MAVTQKTNEDETTRPNLCAVFKALDKARNFKVWVPLHLFGEIYKRE
jgi:hypothetical protein